MKKIIIVFTFITVAFHCVVGQITFQKTYGHLGSELGKAVLQTSDGGYFIAGSTSSSFGAGQSDVYLVKTNNYGDTLWTKTFGSSGNDFGWSVQQNTGGGYIICGYTNSSGSGGNDALLIKTDASGNPTWTKTYGSADSEQARSVRVTNAGGYIVCGFQNVPGDNYFYLLKTDSTGTMNWTKIFGGIGVDFGASVWQAANGGYAFAGNTTSFSSGNSDVYLVRTDSSVTTINFTKVYGGIGNDFAYCVQQTSDNGFIICGYTNSYGAGLNDIYLVKTSVNGIMVWSKAFGGVGDDYGTSVQQTADGGYIITGYTNSFGAGNEDVYLIKTDGNGTLSWSKCYGGIGNDNGLSVRQTSDGGYVVAGHTDSFGAGNNDFYLVKTDSTGNSGCNESNAATVETTPSAGGAVVLPNPTPFSNGTEAIASFTMSSGGATDTLCSNFPTSITNSYQLNGNASFFPNPFSVSSAITFPYEPNEASFSLFNSYGQTVIDLPQILGKQIEIDRNNLNSGVYFYRIKDAHEIILSGKLVIN